MRVVILTSCTNRKRVSLDHAQASASSQQGETWGHTRVAERAQRLVMAEDLYVGEQHCRLMEGVRILRSSGAQVSVHIVSAEYGLLAGNEYVAPYNASFVGLSRYALCQRSEALGLPAAVRQLLEEPFDFGLVTLGQTYLRACAFGANMEMGGVTLVIAGLAGLMQLPRAPRVRVYTLTPQETSRYRCGQVGLKGEIGRRLLSRLAIDPGFLSRLFDGPDITAPLRAALAGSSS